MQEKGYTFYVGGVPQLKHGTICLIPADNLASNALGGFKEGSTATHGCRHCLATPSEMKASFMESSFLLRTPCDHRRKCNQLDLAPTEEDRKKLSKEFGINSRSILNELQYFDVCSGALVQDVMHDVLEGKCMFIQVHVQGTSLHVHTCVYIHVCNAEDFVYIGDL